MAKNLLLLFAAAIMSCKPAIEIVKVNNKTAPEGIFYALPKTQLIVNIPITQTVTASGKYCKYAHLLGLNQACNVKPLEDSLGNISITSQTIPDSQQFYKVIVSKNFFKKTTFSFDFTENNLMTGTELSIEDKTFDFVNEIINSGAAIAGSLAGNRSENKAYILNKDSFGTDTIAYYYAMNIIKLQAQKLDILTSSTKVDKETLTKMLDELTNMENNYLKEFVITTTKTTCNFKTLIDLDKKNYNDNHVLLYFDKYKGIRKGNCIGDFIWKNDFDSRSDIMNDTTKMILKCTLKNPVSNFFDDNLNKDNRHGIYYRIGQQVNIKISYNKKDIYSENFIIPQLGEVISLPYDLENLSIKFYQDLGALQSLSGKSEPMQSKQVGDFGKAASSSIDLFKKKDELETLENKRKILEEKQKIKELEDALNK